MQNLGDEGLQHVSQALQFNNTLRGLDLSRNGLTPKGVAAALQALASAQVLDTLIMDTNSLADEGTAYVATIVGGAGGRVGLRGRRCFTSVYWRGV